MTVKEFLRTHLALGCQLVQSGKMGTPTLEELDICGQLISILEKLAEPLGSEKEV